MTAERVCDLEPFASQVVAQISSPEQAGSAFEIFIQQLEGYLARLRTAICDDLTEIVEECCNGGGATSFLDLSDTPDSYAGAAGDLVVVNGSATGLAFSSVAPVDEDGITLDHSTSEQQTNRIWTDSSAIYQKTVINAGNLATGTVNIAHGISGLNDVLFIRGYADRSNGSQVPIPFPSGTSTFVVSLQVDGTNIILGVGTSWTGAGNVLSNARFTIFYTKS